MIKDFFRFLLKRSWRRHLTVWHHFDDCIWCHMNPSAQTAFWEVNDPVKNRASEFAEAKHAGQKRRYTDEPYFNHCMEVSAIVCHESNRPTRAMLDAAYLHDVVEDCNVELHEIRQRFGDEVADLVYWLTDVSRPTDGPRAKRKAMDRAHIAKAPPAAKTIKLADMISNSKDIAKHDPGFAKVYMKEKALLLPLLKEGDPALYAKAEAILRDYEKSQK